MVWGKNASNTLTAKRDCDEQSFGAHSDQQNPTKMRPENGQTDERDRAPHLQTHTYIANMYCGWLGHTPPKRYCRHSRIAVANIINSFLVCVEDLANINACIKTVITHQYKYNTHTDTQIHSRPFRVYVLFLLSCLCCFILCSCSCCCHRWLCMCVRVLCCLSHLAGTPKRNFRRAKNRNEFCAIAMAPNLAAGSPPNLNQNTYTLMNLCDCMLIRNCVCILLVAELCGPLRIVGKLASQLHQFRRCCYFFL